MTGVEETWPWQRSVTGSEHTNVKTLGVNVDVDGSRPTGYTVTMHDHLMADMPHR